MLGWGVGVGPAVMWVRGWCSRSGRFRWGRNTGNVECSTRAAALALGGVSNPAGMGSNRGRALPIWLALNVGRSTVLTIVCNSHRRVVLLVSALLRAELALDDLS